MLSYVVIGASRGIGLEFVRQLGSSPENVVFAVVRNKNTSSKLAPLLAPNVHLLEGDIVDTLALMAVAAEIAQKTGGSLDVLINNAAYIEQENTHFSLDEYPDDKLEEDLKNSFNVNVIGVIHTINAFLPLLQKGTAKKVVTLTSGRGDPEFTHNVGLYDAAPYSISKAGTNMVNAKYAAKFKSEGFIFLAISPGFVNTNDGPMTAQQVERSKAVLSKVLAVNPNFSGAMTPEESVKMQLRIIDGLTEEDNGKIISHRGDKNWL